MLFEFVVAERRLAVPYEDVVVSSQLVRDYLDSNLLMTNTTQQQSSQQQLVQLPLPTEYSRAIVHYVNFLTVRKKHSLDKELTTEVLLERLALAHFLQADGYFNANIKCLFKHWSSLSPTLYSSVISQAVLERLVIRLPYHYLPNSYQSDTDFLVKWLAVNKDRVVEFENSYYHHMAESYNEGYIDLAGDTSYCCYRSHRNKQPLSSSSISSSSAAAAAAIVVNTNQLLKAAKDKGLIDQVVSFVHNTKLTPAIRNITVDTVKTGVWLEAFGNSLKLENYLAGVLEGSNVFYNVDHKLLLTTNLPQLNLLSKDDNGNNDNDNSSLHHYIISNGGRLRIKANFRDGKRHGYYQHHDSYGRLMSIGQYHDGLKVGAWSEYFNDVVMYIGEYRDGVRVG